LICVKRYRTNRGDTDNAGRTGPGVVKVLGTYRRLKNRFGNRQEGQGLVEYALILVLISVVAIATMGPLGTAVGSIFTTIAGTL
jgi:pilus assembly protein Flp/PilA